MPTGEEVAILNFDGGHKKIYSTFIHTREKGVGVGVFLFLMYFVDIYFVIFMENVYNFILVC